MNMRDLMLALPDQRLEAVMRKDLFTIHCFVDREEAANELPKRRCFAAPVVARLWHGNPYFGVVVGLGMVVNLICAGLAGASIPLMMKRFGLDPAQCSSIILTTVTDVVGFLAFLGVAVLFQGLPV